MQKKEQKGDFLKKPSRELKKKIVLGSYESLEGLELEAASFFAI